MANEKNISLDNLKTFKKKADATYAKKTDITASGLYVGKSDEKSNSATTNGNTYLKLFDNDTKRSQHLINGEGATIVTSDASGTIKIATPIKNLDTTSGSGLGNGRSENIVGSGTIYLHKVAKTGSYNDLVNKPKIPDEPIATERNVSGAIGGWSLMRSIGTKVYSYLPTNIKPSTSTHAASGAPASAGKCLVDVSFFKKQGSLDGTTYPFFKTVIDVTYQGPLFELKPFAVRIGAIPYAYKWYMPRITVSRGSMNSAWFNYMMKSLVGQADGNLVGITFEDVTVARQLLSGNLGGNGIVAPQGGLNEDGFNLFTILMELDTANDGNLAVTGCHYRVVLTHPDNVLMPDE